VYLEHRSALVPQDASILSAAAAAAMASCPCPSPSRRTSNGVDRRSPVKRSQVTSLFRFGGWGTVWASKLWSLSWAHGPYNVFFLNKLEGSKIPTGAFIKRGSNSTEQKSRENRQKEQSQETLKE